MKSEKKAAKSRKKKTTKLDKILRIEEKLLNEEKKVGRKESALENEERQIVAEEQSIETEKKDIEGLERTVSQEHSDLEKLEKIEEEIHKEVGEHPLAKITLRDFAKGCIGAFIGLAIHYTFVYGVEISENLSILRATLLFPITFMVGLLFIYATGFRKVKDAKILVFMPVRLLVLYAASIVMSIIVLFIFYPTFGQTFINSYKMVAGVMLAAVVGACTADLIGKD